MQVAADKHAAVGALAVVLHASLYNMHNLQNTAQAASECRTSNNGMCVICQGADAQQEVPCVLLMAQTRICMQSAYSASRTQVQQGNDNRYQKHIRIVTVFEVTMYQGVATLEA